MPKTKLFVFLAAVLLLGGFLLFGPRHYLSLEFVQSKLGAISEYRQQSPLKAILIFSAIYISATAASIPGALVLTLLGGAIFGFVTGSAIVAVSATIGATIAFLLSRYLFDDLVKQKMGERLAKIRHNFEKEGAMYLFSMRLVPVFPFFAINLLMGLTSIKTPSYVIASLIGMLPGTMVFVNAGTQLSKLKSLQGLLSPAIIASFLLLAGFPYIAKLLLRQIRSRKIIQEK